MNERRVEQIAMKIICGEEVILRIYLGDSNWVDYPLRKEQPLLLIEDGVRAAMWFVSRAK